MAPVWLIIQREFWSRVRGKGFIIATVVGLVAIIGLNFAPSIGNALFSGTQRHVAVVDRTGRFYDLLQQQLTDRLPNGRLHYVLTASSAPLTDLDRRVSSGELDAYLVIGQAGSAGSTGEDFQFTLVSRSAPSTADLTRLSAALSSAAAFVRLEDAGISREEAAATFAPVNVESRVTGRTGQTEQAAAESWGLTYIFVLLLYMTVIFYGTYLTMGVIEDKSSRVIEILLSAVRPFQLMMGKVFGIGLVALLQYAVWIAAGAFLLIGRGAFDTITIGPISLEFSGMNPWLLPAFALFFLIGFFSYAGLFAAGGSMVSRQEDAQQVTLPVTMVLVVVLFLAMEAIGNPDGGLAVVLSMVPLFSPIIMFVRIAVGEPSTWQVIVSVGLSITVIVLQIWAAAKVFRAGTLLYGRRVSLSAIAKALR